MGARDRGFGIGERPPVVSARRRRNRAKSRLKALPVTRIFPKQQRREVVPPHHWGPKWNRSSCLMIA